MSNRLVWDWLSIPIKKPLSVIDHNGNYQNFLNQLLYIIIIMEKKNDILIKLWWFDYKPQCFADRLLWFDEK